MAEQFKLLFSPLKIGPMTIRNRIVSPAHGVIFEPGHGEMNDRIISYMVERAKGGVGMMIKSNYVTPSSWDSKGSWGGEVPVTGNGTFSRCNDDSLISEFARLATEVHRHGAKILSQLNAAGRQGAMDPSYRMPLWAPSALPCPVNRHIPKEMEVEDIQDYVEAFAHGARNMREAGWDGVELFSAQGYLLSEFLSPHVNRRTDEYGGSLENRMRFLLESLEAIRRDVGRDFVVGVRMNGDDYAPDGVTSEMAQQVAVRLADSGLVDYLNVSGMTYLSWPGWIADMTAPPGMFTHLAEIIKRSAPHMPVCVVSRIGDPVQAEKVLADGQADMVGMVRPLISDPELPKKAQQGDLEGIRYCTFCNQSCIQRLMTGRGVSCIHNPAVGHEAELGVGTLRPASTSKRVVVVGGGPAGMAAARVAAQRGHDVTLYERDTVLGGQNNLTAKIESRRNFAETTRWQEYQMYKAGVKVRLGREASADTVLADNPDAVVMATGSTPLRSGYSSHRPDVMALPGVGQENVLTVWGALKDPESVGPNVVLVDEDPHFAGLYTAEYLADQGRKVEVICPGVHPGRDIPLDFVTSVYQRILPKGIQITPNTLVKEIRGSEVVCYNKYTQEERRIGGVDTVVIAMGNKADNELYFALKGKTGELHAIGDCLAPRNLEAAIYDGERVGRML